MFRNCAGHCVKMAATFISALAERSRLFMRPLFYVRLRASRFALCGASALLGFCLPSMATPTTNPLPGPTGLGGIPTTQTVVPGGIEATIAYERASIPGGGNGQFEPFINATFGFKRGEVGVSYAYERTNFGNLGGGVLPIGGGGGIPIGGGTIPTIGGTIPIIGGTIPTGGGTIPTGGIPFPFPFPFPIGGVPGSLNALKRHSSLGRTSAAEGDPVPVSPIALGLAGTSTTFSSNYFVVHAKYRLYEQDDFAVAVGAHYYNFGRSQGASLGNTGSLYATGSYDLRDGDDTRAQFHLGLLGQRTSGGGVRSQTVVRPFVGAEVFAPDLQLSLAADYLAKNKDAASAYTFALRFQPFDDESERVGGELGVGRQAGGTKYLASLTYRFGR